jgi:mono/diheme cytochrome c family protein
MRARYSIATVIFAIFGTVLLVRFGLGPGPPDAQPQTISYPETQEARIERGEVQVDAAATVPPASTPAGSPATTTAQGQSILESHCAQCHVVEGLQQIKKSPSEWDYTLAQMEALGASLDEQEKVILLDYLAVTGKP